MYSSLDLHRFFLEDDYPSELEEEIDEYISERVKKHFEIAFSSLEKSKVFFFSDPDYKIENIEEIADKKGQNSLLGEEEPLSIGAYQLLERYNRKAEESYNLGPLDDQKFTKFELEYLSKNILEDLEPERIVDSIKLNDGTYISSNREVKYCAGNNLSIEDVERLATVLDEDIEFQHAYSADAVATPEGCSPPDVYEDQVTFNHEVPGAEIKAYENSSELHLRRYRDDTEKLLNILYDEVPKTDLTLD